MTTASPAPSRQPDVAEPPQRQTVDGTRPRRVAIVGNPNSGKTTLFNRLTGMRQKVGNYPGVTVEKRIGTLKLEQQTAEIIDLPGTYSLAASSADERVVVDVLSGHVGRNTAVEPAPDLIVCVVDATNLHRHLFLASQLAEIGRPMVLVLNLIDDAEQNGIAIDRKLLAERLGVPVVATAASKGRGIDELRQTIDEALQRGAVMHRPDWPQAVQDAVAAWRQGLKEILADNAAADELTPAELQRLVFDEDSAIADRLGLDLAEHRRLFERGRKHLESADLQPCCVEATVRYSHVNRMLEDVISLPAERKATGSESIDAILTHRVAGLLVFVGVMYAVFWAIYTGAGPLMDLTDAGFGAVGETVGGWLADSPMLQSLVVDGVIAGVGGVVIFLPQILILFFFISLLEDSGYMARAAFLMDKLFSWCGLNGKSFVPLLSSYACAVPGILAARTIDNPKARLSTILIAPLMSCSARLPVYVLLIGAFVEPRYDAAIAAAVLFAFHLVGLVVGIPLAMLFNRVIFRTKRSPFVMEMPSYRLPALRDVLWRMWQRGLDFLKTAGTVIFAMSIIIWALSYFPRPAEVEQQVTTQMAQQPDVTEEEVAAAVDAAYLEQSFLGRAGKTVQPVFAPAGFDWKTTVGVLASFPAREVIVSTLGITYSLGGDVDEENEGLIAAMQNARHPNGELVFTIPVALAVMVFFALCLQCGATVATIARESNWGWAIFAFTYMTVLAWGGAVITYQVGSAVMS